MKSRLFVLILLVSSLTFKSLTAQTFNLPEGYNIFKDFEDKQQRAEGDFDTDGIDDLAIMCTKSDDGNVVLVFLSSDYNKYGISYSFPWNSDLNTLDFNDNILSVGSNELAGRFIRTLQFRYNAKLKNMQLIKYEEHNTAGYNQDNYYYKNIDFITGEYQIHGIKRNIDFNVISLINVEKYIDYFGSLN